MEREEEKKEPTIEDLKASELYFSELENALRSYSSRLPEGSNILRNNFPPLDDLQTHFERLKFAAGKLDHVPVTFWKDFYSKQLKGSRDIPHVPMQIVLWGASNDEMRKFRREALSYEELLSNYSWTESDNPDTDRDHAEQCMRILYSCIQLSSQTQVQ